MHTLDNEADRQSIRARLAAVRPDDKHQWGVMSAAEMVCHVRGAFRAAMGEVESNPISIGIPPSQLKAIALCSPTPWKPNFFTLPALKQGAPAMCPGIFDQDLAEALAELDRFCNPDQSRVDHAFFGAMSYADWMRWGFLHTDHHLRQFAR